MVSGKFPTPEPNEIDLAELQLRQELRAMFEVDSQKYLQDYLNLVQHLQPQSWTRDIQELYRLIHTIKGSSVTVGADAILRVAAVLENMLSDLRHLNPAPPLSDGCLCLILREAGELLAGSLQVKATGEEALIIVQPSVQRMHSLREQVKQIYLPEWNEQRLLHVEFAEQGFDLVVLDLEMALEEMPPQGEVSSETVEVAQQTLAQLTEIGKDLEFTRGWMELLHHSEDLLSHPSVEVWRSHLPGYLKALKESARQGGKYVEPEQIILPEPVESALPEETEEMLSSDSVSSELSAIDESLLADLDGAYKPRGRGRSLVPPLENPVPHSIRGTAPYELAAYLPTEVELPQSSSEEILATEPKELSQLELAELSEAAEELAQLDLGELTEAADALTTLDLDNDAPTPAPDIPLASETSEEWLGLVSPPTQSAARTAAESGIAASPLKPQSILPTSLAEAQANNIQIPVPLNRLDHTAQSLVEALLTVRISQGLYQNLQAQLIQLFTLAKESAQYITRLRQLQDDYALLDKLKSSSNPAEGLTLERYRQGYSTLNRLLETSLRLSELGAEAEKTTLLTTDNWQILERNILRLRQNVEQSRLVPFRNLVFRVRAILRDLITRCGKPARLTVEGEQIELDAGTNSKLEPALLHLIRNAYDHGVENAEERIAGGKQEEGTITLSLKRRGNTYHLDVRDDGRGIDADAIRQSAETKGLPLTTTQTPAELLTVICQPGFSCKDAVSDISGRGVGMDVVAEQVASLGGRLNLVTEPGIGTTFQLQFPVPQLLMSCVLIQAGDRTLAIPTQDITTTTILDNLQATQVRDSNGVCTWKIQQGEETLLGLDLLEYWQPQAAKRSLPDTAICIYVRPAQQSQGIWVLADELLGQTELLVTPLPSPLVSPLGILGASLQPDGSLVPVVEVATLAEVLLQYPAQVTKHLSAQTSVIETKAAPTLPEQEESAQDKRTILVVDDAALMRRRIEASLTAYGYTVNTCADGQEAWNWLSTNPTPAMVITDIEMPHMDGFTLIDRARQAGMTIPIVVVSSRLAENWSKEARRLRATDYLTKGFSTYELINKVKSLLA